ncbi:MAG: TetR/AcrR family transcriptional regulator [Verrucomicrobiaceae bacterium]|nr:TetR/AcrR family transcriptional regulator [Verrucomicrobiaceae bacterium]
MRYGPEHKQAARKRILQAAGRGFRKNGYGGIGVDGLAKAAGVTSGAFYGHFSSKDEAFKLAVIEGLEELRGGVVHLRETLDAQWLPAFVDYFLGAKRLCDLDDSCASQSLTSEVGRAPATIKKEFETKMIEVIEAIAGGLKSGSIEQRRQKAWGLMSVLTGAVTMARAVNDQAIGESIALAARQMALNSGADS